MRKLTMLIAAGVGYVLGARAGRTRYEQIRSATARGGQQPESPEGRARSPGRPRPAGGRRGRGGQGKGRRGNVKSHRRRAADGDSAIGMQATP